MWIRILTPRGDGEDDPVSTSKSKPETPPATQTSFFMPTTTTRRAISVTAVLASTTSSASISSTITTSKSVLTTSLTTPPPVAQATSTPLATSTSSTTKSLSSKSSSAASASSTLISSSRTGSSPTVAADSLSSTASVTPTAQLHNVASNTLIVFGSLGIVAILIMLVAVIVILKKKKRTPPANNQFNIEAQPGGPSPQPQMQAAYMPPTGTMTSDDRPFDSSNNTRSMTSNPVPMAVPMPALRGADEYQQFVPTPLNVYREDRRQSADYDPFADPPYDRPITRGNGTRPDDNQSPFADPTYNQPDNTTKESFTAPPYGRPPPNTTSTYSTASAAAGVARETSKFSNFRSLLNPTGTGGSDRGSEAGERRRVESQSTVGRGSKFSNFRSLMGSGAAADAAWEAEEQRRAEDQRKALAALAGQQAAPAPLPPPSRSYF